MKRTKICILPKLSDSGGNLKKRWFVYYSYRNPKTGVMTRFRNYEGFTEARTKKAKYELAEKMIAEFTKKLNSGWNPFSEESEKAIYDDNLQYSTAIRIFKTARSGNKTFNYYSNLFLPEVKGMADKTYKNYVSKFRIFDAWLIKNGMEGNDISAITEDVMRRFFLFLINDEMLARITVVKYRHMLDRVFNFCVKNKYIRVSPMHDLPDTTRENDQAPRPIHEGDINRLVSEIRDNDRQLWLTVQLEYYCFLRPGLEIRLARVGWFDLARGVINIPKDVVKTDSNKMVIIPNQFREYLLKEWKLQNFPSNYYLIGQNGMPGPAHLGSNNLRNRFNIIRDRLQLPNHYKLYSWKHTGNAKAADAGIPAYHRQMQNGHSSMRSLEEYLKNKIGFQSAEIRENFPSI